MYIVRSSQTLYIKFVRHDLACALRRAARLLAASKGPTYKFIFDEKVHHIMICNSCSNN